MVTANVIDRHLDNNIGTHHAIDAILIGLTNQSWLQELSNTFRENMGVIDDVARQNIKKVMEKLSEIYFLKLSSFVYRPTASESKDNSLK